MAVDLASGTDVGPPPCIFCVSGRGSPNALAEFLPDRAIAQAHNFHFRQFAANRINDLSSSFWKDLPGAAGLAVDLFGQTSVSPPDLLRALATSPVRESCPILARVSNLQMPATVGDAVAFHMRICGLERANVNFWIDGDIDSMWWPNFRVRWKVEYPPTAAGIERCMDAFLESAVRRHWEIWQPLHVRIRVALS